MRDELKGLSSEQTGFCLTEISVSALVFCVAGCSILLWFAILAVL